MAYCLKKPKPICSAYEETELVLQTDKGLYTWAQAHQNDTEGVNILPLKTSNADVEMLVGSSTMPVGQRQLPTLFYRINTSGITIISAGGVSSPIPFEAGHQYSCSISKLFIDTNSANNVPLGGYIEMIIDQTYGNTLFGRNITPQKQFSDFIQRVQLDASLVSSDNYPDMLSPLKMTFTVQSPPDGISEWTLPGLTTWFNFRGCLGIPQGLQFTQNGFYGHTSKMSFVHSMVEISFILTENIEDTWQYLLAMSDIDGNILIRIGFYNGQLRVVGGPMIASITLNQLHQIVACFNSINKTLVVIVDGISSEVISISDISAGSSFYIGGGSSSSAHIILYTFRVFNTIWDTEYINRNLWNNGNPLDVIIPYAMTIRTEVASEYRYGCMFEFLPWIISDNKSTTIRSTVGKFSLNLSQSPDAFWSIYHPNFHNATSKDVLFLKKVTATSIMLNEGNEYLPYLPSPADLLNSLSPTDTTLPTITVNVEQSDESTHTVILSSEADTAGKVRYDLGWIFKSSFLNEKSGYYDKNLYGNYTVHNIPGEETTQENASRLFMRHISQYGHISDMQTNGVTMLMSPACWIWYEGYPLIMVVNANSLTVGPYLYGASFDGTKKGSQLPAGITVIDFSNTYSWEIRNTPLSSISYFNPQYYCLRGCIPPNPFYVRWINEKGGYDFWMFKAYPSAEQEIEDIINTLPYPSDQYRIWHRASAMGRKRITVGDGLLTREEFECLKFIPRSPLVEWYDESIGKWQTVVFEDSISVTWNSRSGLGDIEYTFTLPPIRLQQL